MRLLKLAARNLLRNRRRTGITLAGIVVGLAMMLWTVTLTNGIYAAAVEGAIASQCGSVVVQHRDYADQRKPDLVVQGASDVGAQLRSAYPDAVVAPRILLGGMLSSATGAARVGLTAFVPEIERGLQDLHEDVVGGAWLEQDDREIIVGADIARRLKVGVGDKVVFTGQYGTDDVESRLFRVKGVFRSGAAQVDGRVAYAHLEAGQALLGGADVAHRITLHLDDPEDAAEAAARLRTLLDRPDLAVLDWRQAMPDLVGLLAVTDASTHMMLAGLGFIIALAVLNTMLMSVLERTREFGMMKAIGLKPGQVRQIVLLEGLILGVVGTLLGLALGIPAALYLVHHGLDYAAMGMGEKMETGGVYVDSLIHGVLIPSQVAIYAVCAVLFCVLATAWPAWRISRLAPVDALGHH